MRVLAAVASLALFAACGVPTDEDAVLADPEAVPFELLDEPPPTTTTTEAPPPSARSSIQVCFRTDTNVVPVIRPFQEPPDPTVDVLVTLVNDSPTAEERAAGLRSAMFSEQLVTSAVVAAGIARVDLAATFQEGTGGDQLFALAQIVCTLTSQPGVGQVLFTLGGAATEVPRGDGSLTANPVSRDDYAPVIAPG